MDDYSLGQCVGWLIPGYIDLAFHSLEYGGQNCQLCRHSLGRQDGGLLDVICVRNNYTA